MGTQYSEPHGGAPALLAVDTGSPVASVAVGRPGARPVVRTIEQRRSSEALLRLIAEALEEAGLGLDELDGLLGLAGPGSFTGLRVGLATLLGLHQATGLPATAVGSFDVLAFAAAAQPGTRASEPVVAAVNALRGEWFTRSFLAGQPLEEPVLRRPGDLRELLPCRLSAFGAGQLARSAGQPDGLSVFEPEALAAAALELARERSLDWDPQRLTRPLYLRPPAVTTGVPPGP